MTSKPINSNTGIEQPEINTGIEQLDQDLRAFFDQEKKGGLQKARELLENPDADHQKIFDLFDVNVLRVGLALVMEEQYQFLHKSVQETTRPLLETARKMAQKYLSGLTTYPAIIERIKQATQDMLKKRPAPRAMLNTIRSMTHMDSLVPIETERLYPIFRIGLGDESGKLLLDTTMGWDDLLFVVSGFLEILSDSMEKWKPVIKNGKMEFVMPVDIIKKRITDTKRFLEQIEGMASDYGIDLSQGKT